MILARHLQRLQGRWTAVRIEAQLTNKSWHSSFPTLYRFLAVNIFWTISSRTWCMQCHLMQITRRLFYGLFAHSFAMAGGGSGSKFNVSRTRSFAICSIPLNLRSRMSTFAGVKLLIWLPSCIHSKKLSPGIGM